MQAIFVFLFVTFAFAAAQECGQLKSGEVDDSKTELPWLVQLRERASNDIVCTGSLISNQHALFAAHCIWPKSYFVSLKDNSNIYVTIKNANAELMEVQIHPDWKFNKENYDADIAIVTLFNPVSLSSVVQPICLPSQNSGDLIAPRGVVVGMNIIDKSSVRQRVSLEKNDECFRNFPIGVRNVSPRTFCANWTGENLELANGFSGAYYYPTGNSWSIQGVESESFVQKNQCDIKKHSVFTNVAHYIDWIQKIIKRDSDTHFKDVELQCTFIKNYEGLYGCEVENLLVDSPDVRISSVSGRHQDKNTNNDVAYVWIRNSRTSFLPRFEAGIFFPNLIKYLVTNSGLKFVDQNDFSEMPKLETLDLSNNQIQEIPEDTLHRSKELVDLFISNNNIKKLPSTLLSYAPNFQRFTASNNSLESLDADLFKNTPILKIVNLDNNKLQKIYVDFTPFGNLKKIDLQNNPCINTNYNDWRHHKSAAIVQKEIETSCR